MAGKIAKFPAMGNTIENSVGLVQSLDFHIPCGPQGFMLQSGAYLPEVVVRYETYGSLAPNGDNVVWVCSPLTADAHAAGYHDDADRKAGWWDALIGPGKAIDTRRFFVVCSNILGGCKGTTGPSSIDPRTGKPYGSAFPNITIGDMVAVQKALADGLGVQRVHAVIGGSMGGFQAMKWALDYADFVEKCVIIASTTRLSSQALGFEIVGRDIILSDPNFQGGDYYDGALPADGLANARKLAHITYLSPESMEQKFGRSMGEGRDPKRFQTAFQLESYLRYQGDRFVERFDANSYLHITWAMDQFDLEAEYGSLASAFSRMKAEVLNINLSTDWLFPPGESRKITEVLLNLGKVVTSVELDTPFGHDGFLLEVGDLGEVVGRFLDTRAGKNADAHTDVPIFHDRADFALLGSMIGRNSRILDLGCGDGRLIDTLWRTHDVSGVGVDRDFSSILNCLDRDVPVIQLDLDAGLANICDGSFDYVVLNRTLQEMRDPRRLLGEILRVGKKAIISFPNFGQWTVRTALWWRGRMPKSKSLPYEWYDTPNIHLFTLRDFTRLCQSMGLEIEQLHFVNQSVSAKLLCSLGLTNMGAEQVVALIGRK